MSMIDSLEVMTKLRTCMYRPIFKKIMPSRILTLRDKISLLNPAACAHSFLTARYHLQNEFSGASHDAETKQAPPSAGLRMSGTSTSFGWTQLAFRNLFTPRWLTISEIAEENRSPRNNFIHAKTEIQLTHSQAILAYSHRDQVYTAEVSFARTMHQQLIMKL